MEEIALLKIEKISKIKGEMNTMLTHFKYNNSHFAELVT